MGVFTRLEKRLLLLSMFLVVFTMTFAHKTDIGHSRFTQSIEQPLPGLNAVSKKEVFGKRLVQVIFSKDKTESH